jgi:RpiR family carbohydrate utilization transcriptional regulator
MGLDFGIGLMTSSSARRPDSNVLESVRAALPDLRKSDAKVARLVLEQPSWILDATVATLSKRAGVSQPTVIRFCTAVGFNGFQEFKLRLAQTLALGRPATHSVISATESLDGVSDKIFEYTLSSLDWARQHLDRNALGRAVQILAAARSIEFFGYGASGIVARDAEQKFPLFGVPCRAQPDFHQQVMAASMMKRGDVALVISNTGRTRQIVEVAEIARANGAKVIGLLGAEGPVSAQCDVTLLVETLDNTNVYTPTTSRIAALVMIDILSTAVALRREDSHGLRLQEMKRRLNAARSVPETEEGASTARLKPRTRRR